MCVCVWGGGGGSWCFRPLFRSRSFLASDILILVGWFFLSLERERERERERRERDSERERMRSSDELHVGEMSSLCSSCPWKDLSIVEVIQRGTAGAKQLLYIALVHTSHACLHVYRASKYQSCPTIVKYLESL